MYEMEKKNQTISKRLEILSIVEISVHFSCFSFYFSSSLD